MRQCPTDLDVYKLSQSYFDLLGRKKTKNNSIGPSFRQILGDMGNVYTDTSPFYLSYDVFQDFSRQAWKDDVH